MENTFIIFATIGQMKNYIKRHKKNEYLQSEACGCCWTEASYRIYNKRLLFSVRGESRGHYGESIKIIGKLKKKNMLDK